MGETTNQIENYIENKRDDLGANLQELEQKVKSATDWRQYFQKHSMTMVGLAFGGGVLLASMISGPKRHKNSKSELRALSTASNSSADTQKNKLVETLDGIKGALMGVAATRVKDFIGEIVPGFHEHLQMVEGNASGSGKVNGSPSRKITQGYDESTSAS